MTKRPRANRHGRVAVIVPAPVDAVWRVVVDVTRTGEWSHECLQVQWTGATDRAAPGARFRGRNRAGRLGWSRACEMLTVDPPRRLVWRTVPTWRYVDSTEWIISLTPTTDGTEIVQEYRLVKCPRWWEWLATRLIPSHVDRDAALAEDLRRLGAVAMRATS